MMALGNGSFGRAAAKAVAERSVRRRRARLLKFAALKRPLARANQVAARLEPPERLRLIYWFGDFHLPFDG
jgi:hypothetical protein